ncbi:MAG TPA: SDR family NAD(P)-dependent oxidoreductase [Mariprofundaceae bacterium]|nr:SDR family NAD(P)-dependent oxidoreductase [Mariprofundaceae bacterium]
MQPSVLITGASGGFGYEFARRIEPLGYRLILHGRDLPRLQLTLNALKQPAKHRCITADLTSDDELNRLIDKIRQETGLEGVVNNAGFGLWGLFHHREIIAQLDVLCTDLNAPVALTHALLPQLIRHNGFLINVSSLAGESPLPYMSTYAAAKAGLTYWSEALRAELTGQVRVVTLAPGPSPTGFRDISGMPKGTGSFFRTPSSVVVQAALDRLEKGGGYCVPGMRHKLLYTLQRIVPRRLALRIMHRQMGASNRRYPGSFSS